MKVVEGSLKINTSPQGMRVSFLTRDIHEADRILAKCQGKPLNVKIEPIRKKRSLDANSYMWVVADKIAAEVHSTKVDVYRKAVRDVGVWADVAIETKALPTFMDLWDSKGEGWFTDVSASKLKGCTKVRCYYGSSCYDSKQMARLIDYLVESAKDMGLETMPPDEIRRLTMEWGMK